jgi:hypothetical protein
MPLITCQAFSGYALGFAEDTDPNKNIKTPNKKIILKPLLTIN